LSLNGGPRPGLGLGPEPIHGRRKVGTARLKVDRYLVNIIQSS